MLIRYLSKRKHEVRIHERLSNGQYLNLYFACYPHESGIHVWITGLFIGAKKEGNKFWIGKKTKTVITGKCGLEGLKKSLDYIMEFASSLKQNEELHVGWEDERRKLAYRRLLKYGFQLHEDCYNYRNPEYWDRIETRAKLWEFNL
jgi:hypothetical protein